jgi:hypothetical protein
VSSPPCGEPQSQGWATPGAQLAGVSSLGEDERAAGRDDRLPYVRDQVHKIPAQSRYGWAREELNLRPLPCQIQRTCAGLYVGWLGMGKNRQKAAGERWYQGPSAPTFHHYSPTVVLVLTAVGCCPSAALIRLLTSSRVCF